MLLPANPADPAAMVGAAMGVLKGVGSVAGTPGVIEACVLHLPHAFHMPATQPPRRQVSLRPRFRIHIAHYIQPLQDVIGLDFASISRITSSFTWHGPVARLSSS